MKVKLPFQVVLLLRGEGSKTPITVFPHEVEILKYIHGEGNIIETNDTPPIEFSEFETEDELNRLEEYYKGDNENPNPTRKVFRTLADFEAAFQNISETGSGDDDKEALIAEAKALGINATKNWGIAKLQEAIEAAQANAGDGGDDLGNEE